MHQNHALVPLCQILDNSNLFKCQISKPTSRGLLVRGATCLYGFPTYLQGTVCLEAACLYPLRTYLQGIVCQGCSLFLQFPILLTGECRYMAQPVYTVQNLPNRDCWFGMQPVNMVSEHI